MRHPTLSLAIAMLFAGCGSKLGSPHEAILGKWRAPDPYGGDIWIFTDNGRFTAEGGRRRGADGSSAIMQNVPRSGKWGEKAGVVTLEYATLSAREKPVYHWHREGPRLTFTKPGDNAPTIILDRTR